MDILLSFIQTHKIISAVLLILNSILCYFLYGKLYIFFNSHVQEGYGNRKDINLKYAIFIKYAKEYMNEAGTRLWNINFVNVMLKKTVKDAKQCGFEEKTGTVVLILIRYILPVVFALLAFIANKGDVSLTVFAFIVVIVPVEAIISYYKKARSAEFESSAYNIYKFLYNQVSAGVSTIDSLKSMYRVVEDEKLQRQLILLSASYTSSLDLKASLDEFQSNYAGRDAKGLCIAISQGILTGNNESMLERKEDEMFQRYFNQIEAQTLRCSRIADISIVIFLIIITIMFAIPLILDTKNGLGQMFIG